VYDGGTSPSWEVEDESDCVEEIRDSTEPTDDPDRVDTDMLGGKY
jgi:hypothetical protein